MCEAAEAVAVEAAGTRIWAFSARERGGACGGGAPGRARTDGASENGLRVRGCLAGAEGLSVRGRGGGPLCCS